MKFKFYIYDKNPVHTRVRVFSGTDEYHFGCNGELCFRNEEWEKFEKEIIKNKKIIVSQESPTDRDKE